MAPQSSIRKVLITGLSGFTGQHLANCLIQAGWQVAGLGGKRLDCECDHLDADLNDTDRLSNWIRQVQPTHVIHLAALAHVTGSDALSYYRVNVLGTESLLNAIDRAEVAVEKVIIASSANIYGNAALSPIVEAAEPQPVNHYALSKFAMEALVRKWFTRMPVLIVRPFNYTGPGQSESFVFSKIVGAFARREQEIRLGNLDVSRDLSDVAFVVEAYLRLLTADRTSDVVNICSGRSISLMSVIEEMVQIAGYRPKITIDPAFVRSDEVKELYGSPAKLFDIVGNINVPGLHETLLTMYKQKALT